MNLDIEARLRTVESQVRAGRLDEAANTLSQVLEHVPARHDLRFHYGALLARLGKRDAAVQQLRLATQSGPSVPAYRMALADLLEQSGDVFGAVAEYEQVLARQPNSIEAHGTLANLLQSLGRYAQAEQHYRAILAFSPNSIPALVNLAGVLHELQRDAEAIEVCQKAIQLAPDLPQAHNNLGVALGAVRRDGEAKAVLERAVALKPDYAEAYNNLGNAWLNEDELVRARWCYEQALRYKADYPEALTSLGRVLAFQRDLDGAEYKIKRALELRSDDAEALFNLAFVKQLQGRVDEAIGMTRRVVELRPEFVDGWRLHFLMMLYAPNLSDAERRAIYAAFESRHARPHYPVAPRFLNTPEQKRKIRVGYVSSDLRNHPVARNLLPILENHDRSCFEVFVYDTTHKPDVMTERCKLAADTWRVIVDLTDEAAAELIREDAVDILVMVAGRFDENRPLIAAYRPAPIQVSLNDAATSGLEVMDYFFADIHLVPRHGKESFSERVVHLPTYYVHEPLTGMPDVSALPALQTGRLTFGSFNNPAKVNDEVVALWAAVLRAVPESRLILKYKTLFGQESVRQHYLRLFEKHGITVDRIDLAARQETIQEHLARYAQIDVVLDPFPFTGATATFEALWMGVPVLTLMGDTFMARFSGAMLRKIDLDDFVAETKEQYVDIARSLAGDLEGLAVLRGVLRERVAASPLCNQRARARQVDRMYRWMWRKWCAENQPAEVK